MYIVVIGTQYYVFSYFCSFYNIQIDVVRYIIYILLQIYRDRDIIDPNPSSGRRKLGGIRIYGCNQKKLVGQRKNRNLYTSEDDCHAQGRGGECVCGCGVEGGTLLYQNLIYYKRNFFPRSSGKKEKIAQGGGGVPYAHHTTSTSHSLSPPTPPHTNTTTQHPPPTGRPRFFFFLTLYYI